MTLQSELRKRKSRIDYGHNDYGMVPDARIKELEGALRVAIKHWEGWCNQNNGSLPDNVMGREADDYARALEALK